MRAAQPLLHSSAHRGRYRLQPAMTTPSGVRSKSISSTWPISGHVMRLRSMGSSGRTKLHAMFQGPPSLREPRTRKISRDRGAPAQTVRTAMKS